jgi:hypothetical protein
VLQVRAADQRCIETVTLATTVIRPVEGSRLAGQLGAPVIYIEAIATAPWNRPGFSPQPKYKGVGQILMQAAISLSIDEEFKGRVALHALPQATARFWANRQLLGN